MTATTLTTGFTPADIDKAVRDDEHYANVIERLHGDTRTEFKRQVDAAYTQRHPRTPTPALTDRELAILRFAKRTFPSAGQHEQTIRAELGLSATEYFQRLNWLLDKPAAYEAEPVLVNRLARARALGRARRSARNPTGATR